MLYTSAEHRYCVITVFCVVAPEHVDNMDFSQQNLNLNSLFSLFVGVSEGLRHRGSGEVFGFLITSFIYRFVTWPFASLRFYL